jgi:hypothetical protein
MHCYPVAAGMNFFLCFTAIVRCITKQLDLLTEWTKFAIVLIIQGGTSYVSIELRTVGSSYVSSDAGKVCDVLSLVLVYCEVANGWRLLVADDMDQGLCMSVTRVCRLRLFS